MQNEAGLVVTGRRVLIKMSKVESQSRGGIALPDATIDAEERAQTRGELIDAGIPAYQCPEMAGISIGMTVLFARYAGDSVKHLRQGVTYRVMNATDIVGYLEAEPDSQMVAARPTMETYGA